MLPYFYHLNKQLFSNKLLDELVSFVQHREYGFIDYVSGQYADPNLIRAEFGKDGSSYYVGPQLSDIPEIKTFMEKCIVPCYATIIMHKPRRIVKNHIDEANKRKTVLITPIHPSDGYVPAYYYNSQTDTEPVAACYYSRGQAVLFNTQKWHSVNNTTDEYRFNLQICFDVDFEIMLDLYQNNKFFKE